MWGYTYVVMIWCANNNAEEAVSEYSEHRSFDLVVPSLISSTVNWKFYVIAEWHIITHMPSET